MNQLLAKLKKSSTIKESSLLSESKFFTKKDMIQTSVPMFNVACSGSLDGGFTPGLTMIAGESRNFKTGFALFMAKAFMDKYPESILMFYDSEFGTPISYFETFQIDQNRVLHIPLMDIEQLKFDCVKQLQELNRDDKIIIVIDSIGNLASKKEVEDALNEKSVADMSRAKQLKSYFRMITPYLSLKDIPMIAVNHIYQSQGLYPVDIVGGGKGSSYSANTTFIVGRQQEKDGTDLLGYNFIIKVEKSRYVKEKSKIPISVTFEHGISKWSGLIDVALESGHVVKPSNGWYARADPATGEVEEKKYRLKDTSTSDFWKTIILDKTFSEFVKHKYQIGTGSIMNETNIDISIEEILKEETEND